jgi:hypothetical protein
MCPFPTSPVLHSLYEFFHNPRRIRSGQKDKEKEEYGLLCAVTCCEQETIPHLETTCEIHHINEEENVLIIGTREKSAVGDTAEPKQ